MSLYQDRLMAELRLRGIKTIQEANAFLESVFLKDFNLRFASVPKSLATSSQDSEAGSNHQLSLHIGRGQ